MKKLTVCSVVLLSLLTAGCQALIPLALVGAGAGGTYAISRDTIQGETDISYDSLWDAALLVSKFRGVIQKQDFDKGTIEMMEITSRVWIRLERLTQATTRLRVSSRRYKMPNLDLAQRIYTKIMEQAASSGGTK